MTLTLAATALAAPSAAAPDGPVAHAADRDCGDFPSQAAAQRYFLNHGGPNRDPDRLDADGDGIACESNPCPCNRSKKRPGRGKPKPPTRRAQRISARITEVVDGDTVKVRAFAAKRRRYTVRLIGIDTPETRKPGTPVECGGREATASMLSLGFTAPRDTDGDGLLDAEGGQGRRVTLIIDPTQDTFDRFGRLLAYVEPRTGTQLNVVQLQRGWAKVYVFRKPFRQVKRFRRAQSLARMDRRGVWGKCGGSFHRSTGGASASRGSPSSASVGSSRGPRRQAQSSAPTVSS